jgi:hypothetical protein
MNGALVEYACDWYYGNTPNLEDDLLKIYDDMLGLEGSVTQTVECDNWEYVEDESDTEGDRDQFTLDGLDKTSEVEDDTSEEVVVYGDDDQVCTEGCDRN